MHHGPGPRTDNCVYAWLDWLSSVPGRCVLWRIVCCFVAESVYILSVRTAYDCNNDSLDYASCAAQPASSISAEHVRCCCLFAGSSRQDMRIHDWTADVLAPAWHDMHTYT